MAHDHALNCIIDDSALIAGLKDHTADNLRQWVRDGVINIFVPLYTLETLNKMRMGNSFKSIEARKALAWLDHITSTTDTKSAGRVQLQGPDDMYRNWQDVEKYLLPDTPFSRADDVEALSQALEENNILEENQELPSSNAKATMDVVSEPYSSTQSERHSTVDVIKPHKTPQLNGAAQESTTNGIPSTDIAQEKNDRAATPKGISPQVRPLLNFVVWRTHHQDATIGSGGKYVLLTNDTTMQKQAQKFGVRAKLLSQVRGIVARHTTGTVAVNGAGNDSPKDVQAEKLKPDMKHMDGNDEDDDDDEVVFNPSHRPSSSRGAKKGLNMLDPDHFGRPVGLKHRGNSLNGRGGFPSARRHSVNGRGTMPNGRSSVRGRGAIVPLGPAADRYPMYPAAPRGINGGFRGRGHVFVAREQRYPGGRPIDPDSYVRPPPTIRGRGRGAFRRLWEPN